MCERLYILQKSFCLVMFHRPVIDVPDFSSFCSTPPPPPTTSHLLIGTLQAPSATPHKRLLFGPLTEYNALTDYEPNSWVEVSSEHTPTHYPSNEHDFYTKSNHTATVAASENLDGFQQLAAASSSIILNKRRETVAMTHEALQTRGSAPTCVRAAGNRCVVMSQF